MTGTEDAPRFSVVIPTHAGRTSVRKTVEAFLRQGGEELEVIVVADGDGSVTREVLRDLDDPRLRVFEKPHEGANAARNFGLTQARYEWVGFVDDDDIPRGTWLETWQDMIDESTLAVTAGLALYRHDALDEVKSCRLSLTDPTMGASTLMAGAFVVRRELLRAVGGYDGSLRFAENQDLGLRLIDHVRDHRVEGRVAATDAVVVDVFVEESVGRSKRYGDGQAEVAGAFLDRYPERVSADPGALGAYSRVLARAARQRGDLRAALRHGFTALRRNPGNPENIRSLTLAPLAVLGGVPAWRPRRWESRRAAHPKQPRAIQVQRAARQRKVDGFGRLWGVVVTFHRGETLAATLDSLAQQSRTVDELIIVDNGSSPEVAVLAREAGAHYVDALHNSGPAGGIALGMEFVLARAEERDWLLLIDDDDPPPSETAVEELCRFAEEMSATDPTTGAVGRVGARYDRRSGKMVRVSDRELEGPVAVHYIGGGQLPLYRCDVLRDVGVFDRGLFFGFEEAEFGLRLSTRGYALYADGETWLADRRAKGRLQLDRAALRTSPRTAAWRRYYSLRNSVVIARRYGSVAAPLIVSCGGVLRAVPELIRGGRPLSEVVLPFRAVVNALTGRMGMVVDPGEADKTT